MSDSTQDDRDQTQAFLDELQEIKPGDRFQFRCHPQVSCFNYCCGDLNLVLTPYDVLRLRRGTGLGSEQCIPKHCIISQFPDTGFPALHLRMGDDEPNHTCEFVTDQGCAIYQDRPAACRTYPVGRATRIQDGKVVDQYFMVREDHCTGFKEDGEWTLETWMADQGLERYNHFNDRYATLMARQKAVGTRIGDREAGMCFLALFQIDTFQQFIVQSNLFDRLAIDLQRKTDVMQDEEACLEFGLDWVELVLYGDHDRLQAVCK